MKKDWNLPNLDDAQRRTKAITHFDYTGFIIPDQCKTLGAGLKYHIQTYGCQANERDSETLKGILELMAYTYTDNVENADLIILNTCAIRSSAETRVIGEIGQLKRLKLINPDLMFVVCGCMAQEEVVVSRILSKHPHIDIIFGTHNIHRFPQLLLEAFYSKERVIEVYSKEGEVVENLPVLRNNQFKAWVNIMYGCDKFCTYCIVPYTRGKERSRALKDILVEIESLIADGFKEITLLGQNVNAYGKDLEEPISFSSLLQTVAQMKVERVRFMTSHPWDFSDEMIGIIAENPNIMPYIHLPLQSGNNDILKIMGRRYTREQYYEIYTKLKTKVKGIAFSTDIIVGFPNETEEQFLDTLSIMDLCQFDNVYTFVYSAREHTPASLMADSVPLIEKEARLQRLNKRVGLYALQNNLLMVNQIVKVLVDGPSRKNPNVYSGYTENNKLVNFNKMDAKVGDIVLIEITGAKTWTLQGKLI